MLRPILRRAVWPIVLLQLLLLLSCYVPPRLPYGQDLPELNISMAKYFVKQGRHVQFIDSEMNRHDCVLTGWDDEGFIGTKGDEIKKTEYFNLKDIVFVFNQEENDTRIAEGAAIFAGLTSAFLAGRIFAKATSGDHKVPDALTISFLAVVPVTAGLWYLVGQAKDPRSNGYSSYHFNFEDFMNNPWIGQKDKE